MTFQDMFKKTFLEQFQEGNIGGGEILVALFFSVIIALYIFFLYRFMIRKNMYNINMNLSIVGMTILTTAIILTIQSNLVLSLGMVGALSIVRYRTAVKDPMDLFFLFWAVTGGIICGARQYFLGIVVTVILTAVLFVLSHVPTLKAPYVLVVNGKSLAIENSLKEILEKNRSYYKVKSINGSDKMCRMVIEVRIKNVDDLLKQILENKEVTEASLLTYEGDVIV